MSQGGDKIVLGIVSKKCSGIQTNQPQTHVLFFSQENKTKTWPPKAPWQHASSSSSHALPAPSAPLYPVSGAGGQWSDAVHVLPPPVWAAAGDCTPAPGISASFAYAQPPPPSQHKPINKGFKSFPVKHERRPSYLHQYWQLSIGGNTAQGQTWTAPPLSHTVWWLYPFSR